jgi:hypothetical protein
VTSIFTRESSSSVTFVSIERATLDERQIRPTRGDRVLTWLATGPLGRVAAFLMDLGSLFVIGLDRGVRKLLRLPPAY